VFLQCFLKGAVRRPLLEVECGAVIKALSVAFRNEKEQPCFMLSAYIV